MDRDMKSCCITHAARGQGPTVAMAHDEQVFIRTALKFLDKPGFLIHLANTLGRPIELFMGRLPMRQQKAIHRASENALLKGLRLISRNMGRIPLPLPFAQSQLNSRKVSRWHSLASFGVGAAGGFFGVVSLPIELPVTTAIMLRSIAAIAREFGMDLSDPRVQLECLYVLSMGAPFKSEDDTLTSSAYWASRASFATLSRDAIQHMGAKGAISNSVKDSEKWAAPVLMKLVSTISRRFELVVNEKLMAEAVPLLGAVGGGMINATFTRYFSSVARFHFGLRALENRHGRSAIENYYNQNVRTT